MPLKNGWCSFPSADFTQRSPLGTFSMDVAKAGSMKPGKAALMPPAGGFGRGCGMAQASRNESCRVEPVWLATKSSICSGTATPSMSQRV